MMDQHSHVQKNEANQPSSVVLVIDDEENIVDLITLGLKYEGFEVEAASEGEEGIAAAQRTNPVFIILDRMLPDMDGLEVCRRLRANPTTQDIPILLLSAKDEVGNRVEGLNTGADDYLTKPFNFRGTGSSYSSHSPSSKSYFHSREVSDTPGRRFTTQHGHTRSHTRGVPDRFNCHRV